MRAAASTARSPSNARHRSRVAVAPARVPRRQRHRAGGGLREREHRHAYLLRRQLTRSAATDHEHRRDRDLRPRFGHLADCGGHVARLGEQRRHEDGDDRVAGAAFDQCLEGAPIVLSGGGGDHVDRIAERGRLGQELGECSPDRGRQIDHLDPVRLARVGAEDAGAAAIGDDRDPVPPRHRLGGQQRRDVEQLVHGVGPDHTGLLEQRIDGDVRCRQDRAGVRRRGPRAGSRPSALDGHDRLGGRHPPRDPPELAGVAERLEVEQDELGAGVLLPVLEEVVTGQIRLVPHRDERGQAHAEAAGRADDRDPEPAALRHEADADPPPRPPAAQTSHSAPPRDWC